MSKTGSVPLGDAQMGEVRHVCAFFNGDEESYRVLLPFIAEGFACGHKAIHVIRPDQGADHLRRLTDVGIDVVAARASGQLDVRYNTEVYLSDGRFDQDRMLAEFAQLATGKDGEMKYPLSRMICNMDWASDYPPYQDDLIEFEARVNDIWRRHPDIVICVYDVRRLSGALLIDIMRTHPLVLIGNAVQHNPFFVEPEQFLRQRREARSREPATS